MTRLELILMCLFILFLLQNFIGWTNNTVIRLTMSEFKK